MNTSRSAKKFRKYVFKARNLEFMNTTLVFKKKEFPRVERCDSDSDENNSDNEEDLMV